MALASRKSTSAQRTASTPGLRLRLLRGIALTLLASACGGEPERPRNLLLVSLDTVRADRLGAYGRKDAETPNLDALATAGTRFSDVTAPSPVTLPSHTTLFTGLEPSRHRVRHNGLFALGAGIETLAEHLSNAGLRTGGFVGSVVLAPRHGLARGFETYTAPGLRNAAGTFFLSERAAPAVNADALAWLDAIQGEPFFLFVHYMEAHAPYLPPEPLRQRFAHDPYQGEIAAADHALGRLLRGLQERGLRGNTLVMVVADHGESLGEHGERTHGLFLYQATLRVPLLAAGPGVSRGRVVDTPVGLVDVTPTLLDAMGTATPGALDGRSLWPALGGAPLEPVSALYAETFLPLLDYGWSPLRALRSESLKYISAPRPELFDLERDPGEARDLLFAGRVSAPDSTRSVELADALTRHIERAEREAGEARRVELDEAERSALEALGYLSGAHSSVEEGVLRDPKDGIAVTHAMDRVSQLFQAGSYIEAEVLLREMLARDDTLIEARIRLITALMKSEQRAAAVQAASELARAAQRLPDGHRVAARAHLLMGQVHFEAGQLSEAAADYELAVTVPQPAELYDMLARIYLQLDRREDALRILVRVEERGDATRESLALLAALRSP